VDVKRHHCKSLSVLIQ